MKCPECKTKAKAIDTGNIERKRFSHYENVLDPNATYRWNRCNCGHQFITEEKLVSLMTFKQQSVLVKLKELDVIIKKYGTDPGIRMFVALNEYKDTKKASQRWLYKYMVWRDEGVIPVNKN